MRISAKSEYAILAILDLAKDYDNDNVRTIDEIANGESVPQKFLVQILLELKRAGIVESKRGVGGGYRLARNPRDITLGEIIRLIDGPILPFKCDSPTNEYYDNTCVHNNNCIMKPIWVDVRKAIETILDDVSFEELLSKRTNKNAPMYHI